MLELLEDPKNEKIPPGHVKRYTAKERLLHWIVAISYMLAAFSGLVFFHQGLFWFSGLFAGGVWARILHPFFGLVMAFTFFMQAKMIWSHNIITDEDKVWLSRVWDYMNKREEGLPEVGKYNAGQKMMFWSMIVCTIVLVLSGLVIWRTVSGMTFSAPVHRVAVVLHSIAGYVMYLGIIVHVYAAFWTKGAVPAMVRGYVSLGWIKKHHPKWHKEIAK